MKKNYEQGDFVLPDRNIKTNDEKDNSNVGCWQVVPLRCITYNPRVLIVSSPFYRTIEVQRLSLTYSRSHS